MSEYEIVIKSFMPIYILMGGSILSLLMDWLLSEEKKKHALPSVTLLTLLLSAFSVWNHPDPTLFPGNPSMFYFGNYYVFFALTSIVASIIVVLAAWKDMELELSLGVFYALLMLANIGIFVIGASNNLIPLYIGFEVLSISTYAMIGFRKKSRSAAEAAIKYFLLGALSSGIILFGMSLYYGATHTLQMNASVAAALVSTGSTPNAFGLFTMAVLVAGVSFKIAAVPFHVWVPDVYRGAPLSVTNFLAIGSKAGGFAFLFKLFFVALLTIKAGWAPVWAGLALLTMVIGNLAALPQTSVTRILAYSSIGHVGYILIAMVAFADGSTDLAIVGALYHILANVFMKGTAFVVVLIVVLTRGGDTLDDFKGLGKRDPLVAFFMSIALLSLAGVPPFAGFFGKFFLFYAAVDSGNMYLAIVGIIMSATSLFYYARIIHVMYFYEPADDASNQPQPRFLVLLVALLIANLALSFGAIFYTKNIVDFATQVAQEFFV